MKLKRIDQQLNLQGSTALKKLLNGTKKNKRDSSKRETEPMVRLSDLIDSRKQAEHIDRTLDERDRRRDG